jgi:altronate dehydratase
MSEDMDVDAGRILDGDATLDAVGAEIRGFILTYKSYEPICPGMSAGGVTAARVSYAAGSVSPGW